MTSRSKVYFDVQRGTDSLGRITFELFNDKASRTCENFRTICTSSFTPSANMGGGRPLSYRLSPFHRVIDEFMIQGGDITAGDGTGGASIYGENFEDENIGWRNIDRRGLLCMANRGKDTNSSQFFITLAPCEHLNSKHTIFGHVISGQEVLDKMAKVPVDRKDRPLTELTIARCGELDTRPKTTASVEGASGSKHLTSRQLSPRPSRGRKGVQRSSASSSASRSHSRSRSPHQKNHHHAKNHSPKPRRRSDVAIDETRRGRSLTRSPSPEAISSKTATTRPPHHHHNDRKRSLPPSRPHSRPRSRSPHLRRRRTRSRSPHNRTRRGERGGWRRRDEEALRRAEQEREGGRARWDGAMEGVERYGGRDIFQSGGGGGGGRNRDEGDVDRSGGGGGGGGDESEEPTVRFKGRGSMKYREKKW